MTLNVQHRRRRAYSAIAVGIAVLALFATACSSSGGKEASSSNGGTTTTSNASGTAAGGQSVAAMRADLSKFTAEVTSFPGVAPVSGVGKLRGKTVWYVPAGAAVPILSVFGTGIQAALASAGIKFHTCDGKFLPTSIAACLNQAATQGADGVITGYVDYKLLSNAYTNLVSHHIPVLVAGATNDSGKAPSTQLAFYDTTAGVNQLEKLLAESVISDSNGKAKILFLGVTDSPELIMGAEYAKKYFKENCAHCSFHEVDYATASLAKLNSQVSAALISHPDTDYVVGEVDASAAPALNGIQTAGFSRKVKLASTNGSLDSLQRIKAGQVQYVDIGTSPLYNGWQFADGLIRMLTGSLPAAAPGIFRAFTKANVGGLTLTPAAYATNDWYGTDGFKKSFTTAWGV